MAIPTYMVSIPKGHVCGQKKKKNPETQVPPPSLFSLPFSSLVYLLHSSPSLLLTEDAESLNNAFSLSFDSQFQRGNNKEM